MPSDIATDGLAGSPRNSAGQGGGRREIILRVIMAAILAPAGLWVVAAGGWILLIATALCAGIAAVEWTRMTTTGLHMAYRVVLGLVLVLGAVLATWRAGVGLEAAAIVSLAACVAAAGLAALARGPILSLAFGALYVSMPFAAFVWLRYYAGLQVPSLQGAEPILGLFGTRANVEGAGILMFALLSIVWATDIAAYFAGRGFGGPLLSPKDSPHKTWTGAIGAVFCAGLAAAAFVRWRGGDEVLVQWVVFAVVLSAVAQAGDLLESRFKRLYGVKDTSGVIPGHGGVLDRLDALMAATLMLAIAVRFFPAIVPGFPPGAE
jgi:phosphatidate cytidylyltransferase